MSSKEPMPEIERIQEVMPPPPDDVIMEVVDILKATILAERKARIQSELRACDLEERLFVYDAGVKYGINLAEYTINVDAGKAMRRKD